MKKLSTLVLILSLASLLLGQTGSVRGRVLDATGATIGDATVKLFKGDQQVAETRSSPTGEFQVAAPPGDYRLEITAPDFDTHSEMVKAAQPGSFLSITMNLGQFQQNVEVTTNRDLVSVDPDSNMTATVLDGRAIEDLPDDEEELAAILQEMAGSRGNASGGGEFIVDGFGGGRVPPKSQIQEIRINNNPYTTEHSTPGFGRIEIVTKPGTGEYHGMMMFNFRDEALNARNAFAPAKVPFQQRNFHTNFSGPVIKDKLSMNFFAMQNEQDNSNTVRAVLADGPFNLGVTSPTTRRSINTRGQYALNSSNTLNFNIEYSSNNRRNQGIGNFSLPERAFSSESREIEFQAREVKIINTKWIHEARFEYNRDKSSNNPLTRATAINVLDAFSSGGAQNVSEDRNRRYIFGNMLMFSGQKWTMRTGFQGNYRTSVNRSENNFLGTFVFSSLNDYNAGRPVTFTINQGNPILDVAQFEAGAFFQNDLKITRSFTFSFGTRFEAQTNISDRNNFDPRIGWAYSLGKSTVIRGGAGIFHQRLNLNVYENLLRLDGTRQQQIVIRNPSFPDPFVAGTAQSTPVSIRVRGEDLATPYNLNTSISIERTLPKGLVLTGSFDTIRGVHLYRSRNVNAPLPGQLNRPDPTQGNILQLESTGTSQFRGLTVGFRKQMNSALNFFGNYTLGTNRSDTDGPFSQPADNYNLASEWGRSQDDTRHRLFTGASLRIWKDINLFTMIMAGSNRPYNITTGRDDNGDTNTNDRPFGLERNSGEGPSNFNVNFNVSKTIRFKSQAGGTPSPGNAQASARSFAEPQFGGGGGGQGPHGPVGGRPGMGGPGGGPGGRGPGGMNRPTGPTMTFSVNFQNVFNHTNFTNYSGVLTSPFFGRPTNARNPRQIELGMRFNF